MKIIITDHAAGRMERRKIAREEIIEAIKYPELIIKKHGKYYYRKRLDRGVIEICCERKERYIKVVTMYWL